MAEQAQITVDGIPVGKGYGVEIEHKEMPYDCGVPVAVGGPRYVRYWLTQCGTYRYIRVREIPSDAVITIRRDGKTYIYDQQYPRLR